MIQHNTTHIDRPIVFLICALFVHVSCIHVEACCYGIGGAPSADLYCAPNSLGQPICCIGAHMTPDASDAGIMGSS